MGQCHALRVAPGHQGNLGAWVLELGDGIERKSSLTASPLNPRQRWHRYTYFFHPFFINCYARLVFSHHKACKPGYTTQRHDSSRNVYAALFPGELPITATSGWFTSKGLCLQEQRGCLKSTEVDGSLHPAALLITSSSPALRPCHCLEHNTGAFPLRPPAATSCPVGGLGGGEEKVSTSELSSTHTRHPGIIENHLDIFSISRGFP